ncbi:hypothetical protein QJS10_CPA06g01388 [Acorus calamus]|uniref:Uncharacterized protein n=1 Tax=Acorus calamus TaxID=4465 RepID=A0AAV9EIX7_ACOCL|nr:hypothetical protein QJS10_CPA06g01388 [Acorus calamus]
MQFTKEEVAPITGLPFYSKALDLQSKKISDIRLLQKHFPNKHLHMKDVRAKLIQLYPSNEEEDKQDFMIIEDLRLFVERIRRRDAREGVSLGYIGGCTTVLMVWFYEHTRLRNPSAYEKVSRFFRWGRTNDKSPLVRCLNNFTSSEQIK